MGANIVKGSLDKLIHPIIEGLNTWCLLVTSVSLSSSLSMSELLLHLLPLSSTLFSFSSGRVSLLAKLLGGILEHFA